MINLIDGEGKMERKDENDEKVKNGKRQEKFYVDLRKDRKSLELVYSLLKKTNEKDLGSEVTFTNLVVYALKKLTKKDIEGIQNESLASMDLVQKQLKIYNEKNKTSLDLGEFLVQQLKLK